MGAPAPNMIVRESVKNLISKHEQAAGSMPIIAIGCLVRLCSWAHFWKAQASPVRFDEFGMAYAFP